MGGSLVAGLTELRSELRPTHTLPFFAFRKAMVPPPVTAVVSPLVSVLPVVPSVAEEMPVAFAPSVSTVSLSCWTMSKRAADEATAESGSLSLTLKRAALRFLSEVTQTVPSSRCTCWRVMELTQMAPAMMPISMTSAMTGIAQRCASGETRRRMEERNTHSRWRWLGCLLMASSSLSFARFSCNAVPHGAVLHIVRSYCLTAHAMAGSWDICLSLRTIFTSMQVCLSVTSCSSTLRSTTMLVLVLGPEVAELPCTGDHAYMSPSLGCG